MKVEHLCKKFGDRVVLEDFTSEFPDGRITCLMGKSGGGKTTLLHILMGLIPPDSGKVSGVPKKIAACFQTDRLCDALSAVENVRLVMGKNVSKEVICEHLSRLGLSECADQPVKELSGGMRRRVCLVRAVLFDAEAVFLDEPFKGLDKQTRESAIAYIRETCKGKTVIVVTHDPAEAESLGGTQIQIP